MLTIVKAEEKSMNKVSVLVCGEPRCFHKGRTGPKARPCRQIEVGQRPTIAIRWLLTTLSPSPSYCRLLPGLRSLSG